MLLPTCWVPVVLYGALVRHVALSQFYNLHLAEM